MPNGMVMTDTTTIHYVNRVSQISTMMGRSGESDVSFAHGPDSLCYATLLKASFFVKLVVTCSSTQSESHTA